MKHDMHAANRCLVDSGMRSEHRRSPYPPVRPRPDLATDEFALVECQDRAALTAVLRIQMAVNMLEETSGRVVTAIVDETGINAKHGPP